MVLSAAEKQRRYRAKRDSDPERRAAYLQKERETWQRKKESGKVKSITEQTERTKRIIRKRWRLARRLCDKRKKDKKALITPPTSPDQLNLEAAVPGPSRLVHVYHNISINLVAHSQGLSS